MVDPREMIFQLLTDAHELTPTNVEAIKRFSKKWKCSPYQAILDTNLLSEKRLSDIFGDLLGLERLQTISADQVEAKAFEYVQYKEAEEWEVFPLGFTEDGSGYRVAMADPTDEKVIRELVARTGASIKIYIAERKIIHRAIDELYPVEMQIPALKDYIQST